MKKEVAIVGNGPLTHSDHCEIQASDVVVRFNLTPNFDCGYPKTTELFVAMPPMGSYVRKRKYKKDHAFLQADKVVFPYHPEIVKAKCKPLSLWKKIKGRKLDYTDDLINVCRLYQKDFEVFSVKTYNESCRKLNIYGDRNDFMPSSGFLSILQVIDKYDLSEHSVKIFGFNFSGWAGHDWISERNYIEILHKTKILMIR